MGYAVITGRGVPAGKKHGGKGKMILADKIIRLRKKLGWSQEELADKMNVSRQAVSKWEGAQSTPDLDRILQMSQLFGVTTDYLLKDDMEAEEFSGNGEEGEALHTVTMEEANTYLENRDRTGRRMGLGVLLCVLSPVMLLGLIGATFLEGSALTQTAAVAIGLAALFILVMAAVALFIAVGQKNEPYQYLDGNDFTLAYGVSGMVRERQAQYRETHNRYTILGVCLCILGPLVLVLGSVLFQDVPTVMLCLCLMLLLVGVGAGLLTYTGTVRGGMQRLLREGDYTPENKEKSRRYGKVAPAYWMVVTAGFMAWSFLTDDWKNTWIVWPIAGVLFVALMAILWATDREKKD